MSGDNYGIRHSGTGGVVNNGVQAFGPAARAGGTPTAGGDELWPTSESRSATPSDGNRPADDAVDAPTVFVSYSHDTATHMTAVLALAELLVVNGIHVEIDQWAGVERRDWGAWATRHIAEADFVIVVASPAYRRVGDGLLATDRNRGTQSEAAVIRDRLHGDRNTWVPKLLPVILPGHDVDEIPLFLQPYDVDRYVVTELTDKGITDLLRVITGQPKRVRPARGIVPTLPPEPPALPDRHP
jgi:hypothetical protein